MARLAKRIGLNLTDRPVRPEPPYDLTPAEFETLRYLTEGYDATRIAEARGVAKRTVETQQGRVYAKLGVHSAAEAIAKAYKERLFG